MTAKLTKRLTATIDIDAEFPPEELEPAFVLLERLTARAGDALENLSPETAGRLRRENPLLVRLQRIGAL